MEATTQDNLTESALISLLKSSSIALSASDGHVTCFSAYSLFVASGVFHDMIKSLESKEVFDASDGPITVPFLKGRHLLQLSKWLITWEDSGMMGVCGKSFSESRMHEPNLIPHCPDESADQCPACWEDDFIKTLTLDEAWIYAKAADYLDMPRLMSLMARAIYSCLDKEQESDLQISSIKKALRLPQWSDLSPTEMINISQSLINSDEPGSSAETDIIYTSSSLEECDDPAWTSQSDINSTTNTGTTQDENDSWLVNDQNSNAEDLIVDLSDSSDSQLDEMDVMNESQSWQIFDEKEESFYPDF